MCLNFQVFLPFIVAHNGIIQKTNSDKGDGWGKDQSSRVKIFIRWRHMITHQFSTNKYRTVTKQSTHLVATCLVTIKPRQMPCEEDEHSTCREMDEKMNTLLSQCCVSRVKTVGNPLGPTYSRKYATLPNRLK